MIAVQPIPHITANKIIGSIFVSEEELRINWLLKFANPPKNEVIPNPIPLKGSGKSSVIYKKNTEK